VQIRGQFMTSFNYFQFDVIPGAQSSIWAQSEGGGFGYNDWTTFIVDLLYLFLQAFPDFQVGCRGRD